MQRVYWMELANARQELSYPSDFEFYRIECSAALLQMRQNKISRRDLFRLSDCCGTHLEEAFHLSPAVIEVGSIQLRNTKLVPFTWPLHILPATIEAMCTKSPKTLSLTVLIVRCQTRGWNGSPKWMRLRNSLCSKPLHHTTHFVMLIRTLLFLSSRFRLHSVLPAWCSIPSHWHYDVPSPRLLVGNGKRRKAKNRFYLMSSWWHILVMLSSDYFLQSISSSRLSERVLHIECTVLIAWESIQLA